MKNLGPSCPRYVFIFFTRSKWLWVCLPRAPSNNCLFSSFFLPTGRRCHFRIRVPANHLASPSFPLVSGDLRLLSTNICWYPLCDLHSFLTVTFLTGSHCSFQREDSINLISIVSVGYHVTSVIIDNVHHINSITFNISSLFFFLFCTAEIWVRLIHSNILYAV